MSLYSNTKPSDSPIYMTESEAKKLYESLSNIRVIKENPYDAILSYEKENSEIESAYIDLLTEAACTPIYITEGEKLNAAKSKVIGILSSILNFITKWLSTIGKKILGFIQDKMTKIKNLHISEQLKAIKNGTFGKNKANNSKVSQEDQDTIKQFHSNESALLCEATSDFDAEYSIKSYIDLKRANIVSKYDFETIFSKKLSSDIYKCFEADDDDRSENSIYSKIEYDYFKCEKSEHYYIKVDNILNNYDNLQKNMNDDFEFIKTQIDYLEKQKDSLTKAINDFKNRTIKINDDEDQAKIMRNILANCNLAENNMDVDQPLLSQASKKLSIMKVMFSIINTCAEELNASSILIINKAKEVA